MKPFGGKLHGNDKNELSATFYESIRFGEYDNFFKKARGSFFGATAICSFAFLLPG
jgi:hypothetical protein